MNKATLAIKLNNTIINRLKKFCLELGIKYGFLVEKAINELLDHEELRDDIFDIKSSQSQEKDAVPFETYLRRRNV
ncbi:MAG: hypothetical protein HZA48_08840 [Planctomycetes bacterium]|nr:hypothetical protein [Planctomycetota bacterium]